MSRYFCIGQIPTFIKRYVVKMLSGIISFSVMEHAQISYMHAFSAHADFHLHQKYTFLVLK